MPSASCIVRVSSALLLGATLDSAAASAEELRNWFDDPFFQISSALADCPLPAGPFVSESDKRIQAHRRAEKGTTCWLAGECERPNATPTTRTSPTRSARRSPGATAGRTTLWVTVQGRVLYIEGCALQNSSAAEVEALARSLPHVQQAIALVRTDPTAPPPYKLRSP